MARRWRKQALLPILGDPKKEGFYWLISIVPGEKADHTDIALVRRVSLLEKRASIAFSEQVNVLEMVDPKRWLAILKGIL